MFYHSSRFRILRMRLMIFMALTWGLFLSVAWAVNNPLTVNGSPMYGADPSVVIADDGRLFLFPTTDNRDWEKQFGWSCYSTTDLVNWTDHGMIFDNKMSGWGINKAWAPDVVKRDGRYYSAGSPGRDQ